MNGVCVSSAPIDRRHDRHSSATAPKPEKTQAPMDIQEQIRKVITENDVIIFMKGSPQSPQCGFSMRATQILSACGVEYAHVDVLAEPAVRQNLPAISNWPTFPQVFVRGELVGGCDILVELFQKGELQGLLKPTAG